REYVPGDDLRYLDWKIYGKADRFVIKQFEEETNLRAHLFLDQSESMNYACDGGMSKFDYGATGIASLAYLIQQQADAVGLTLFDEKGLVYLDAKPRSKEIRLPFGADPYGIAIDRAGTYAYVAARHPFLVKGIAASYLFQIDIDPRSASYNRVVRSIQIGADASADSFLSSSIAPSGLRNVAVSSDGLTVYVTAPNENSDPAGPHGWTKLKGKVIEVDMSPTKTGGAPAVNSFNASRETFGIATVQGQPVVAYTNAEDDLKAVYVRNTDTGISRQIKLDLDKLETARNRQLKVHNASGIVLTPDGKYAFVTGRADVVDKTFGGEVIDDIILGGGTTGYLDQMADPLYEAGNIGIIRDPLGSSPQLVAATRPIPYGFPTDIELSPDGRFLFVSYQGLPVQLTPPTFKPDGSVEDPGQIGRGSVFVFDAKAMVTEVENQFQSQSSGVLMRKVAIDDLPLNSGNQRQFNPAIDIRADYRLHETYVYDSNGAIVKDASGNDVKREEFGIPNNRPEFGVVNEGAPIATSGSPGGIAMQTKRFPFTAVDASGDDSPTTVFQHGVVKINYQLPTSGVGATINHVALVATSRGNGAEIVLKDPMPLAMADYMFDFAAMSTPLEMDNYDFQLKIDLSDGTTKYTRNQLITLLSDTVTRGDFTARTILTAALSTPAGVYYGNGGTDTLVVDADLIDVDSLDGDAVGAYAPTPNSPPKQAVFQGSAFDYLRLKDGREYYFQGIERLRFNGGTYKEIQVTPNDPEFVNQWNLAVTDVPLAWRFSTGANNV
ncbi:MAG TPA: DUF58 domain-containing protein, partial [Pirellulaceae bacterium]|nr:DUF58 domain-containing protein [Pirellulaceae bacterium]